MAGRAPSTPPSSAALSTMLAEACDQGDAAALRAILAKAVPGYGTAETRANAA